MIVKVERFEFKCWEFVVGNNLGKYRIFLIF